jgi:hypothetical protein
MRMGDWGLEMGQSGRAAVRRTGPGEVLFTLFDMAKKGA